MTEIGQPLAHVAAIPPYPPGRPVDSVAREFGLDPANIVKLASNENPLGCSPAVAVAIAKLASKPNIYPDFDNYDLRHAIAEQVGLNPDQVLPGEGSSEIISLAVRAYIDADRAAIIPQYSFQAYGGTVRSAAGQIITVPAKDYGVDLEAVLAAVTDNTQIVFLATPNNPTGTLVQRDELDSFVDRLPENILLLLDEAHREFVPEAEQPDVNAMLARRRNMLVMRTFSKLYGLAGLRVDYPMTQFTSFEALSAFCREQIEAPGFDAAFVEQGNLAQLSIHDEPAATDMPDPESARAAMEMIIGTVFDLFRATRMEEFGRDIVWAAARGVKSVRFTLNRALGKRAGFVSNEQLLNLKPVHAVVCEGSGIQSNLLTRVREANVPYHAFAIRHQRVAA